MNSWYVAPSKVLIAEDDGDLLAVIGFALHSAGFEVIKVANGNDALQAFAEHDFSLLVLDINMPLLNGLQVCTRIREHSSVPVLMLSARDQERDLLQALDAGADAYMVKPFSPRALIAHIRALLRRSAFGEAATLQSAGCKLDVEGRELRLPSGEIRLTKLEAKLLQLLMLNADQMVSTKTLIAEVWNTYSTANRNMLKQVVFRLRRKLAHDTAATEALQTIPDGYRWNSNSGATKQAVAAATTAALNC